MVESGGGGHMWQMCWRLVPAVGVVGRGVGVVGRGVGADRRSRRRRGRGARLEVVTIAGIPREAARAGLAAPNADTTEALRCPVATTAAA